MIHSHVMWTINGMPTFLKGKVGKAPVGCEGPTMASAYVEFANLEAIPGGIEAGLNRAAEAMETYAKANAPWTDRTKNARDGLTGYVVNEGANKHAVISHGLDVEYGVWLEQRWNGRYAIIVPTMLAFAGDKVKRLVMDEIELELRGQGSKFRHKATGRWA